MTGAKVRCKDCYWMEHASQVGICPYRSRYMDQDLLRDCKTFLDKNQTRLILEEGPGKDQGNNLWVRRPKQTPPQGPQEKPSPKTPLNLPEYRAPPCWICGRPKKGDWHSAYDPDQDYPLCWFCVGEVNLRVCDGNHEHCGFWQDYTCTRALTLQEMIGLKNQIMKDKAGGFKYKGAVFQKVHQSNTLNQKMARYAHGPFEGSSGKRRGSQICAGP